VDAWRVVPGPSRNITFEPEPKRTPSGYGELAPLPPPITQHRVDHPRRLPTRFEPSPPDHWLVVRGGSNAPNGLRPKVARTNLGRLIDIFKERMENPFYER